MELMQLKLLQKHNNKNISVTKCSIICISEMIDNQIDNAKELDIVMPMYNLLEYREKYSKTLGSLWQFHQNVLHIESNRDISNSGNATAETG